MKQDSTEPVESSAGEEQNLGLLLQTARDSSGTSLEEIAAELRIEPHLLRALEECRFEDLGAPVFAKGYLKQYGARLGLDYKNLLSEYYRLVDPNDVDIAPPRTIKLRDERQITIWLLSALAIGLLAVFLLIWWLGEPAGSARVESTPVAEQEPVPPPPGTANPAEPAAIIAPRSVETDPVVADGPVAAIPEPGIQMPADDAATEETTNVPAVPQVANLAPSTAVTESVSQLASTTAVELQFTEDCWTEVTDARGDRLFYGLGEAGARSSFAGAAPISFVLGNANGVEITVDNRPYAIPTSARRGRLARFTVAGAIN